MSNWVYRVQAWHAQMLMLFLVCVCVSGGESACGCSCVCVCVRQVSKESQGVQAKTLYFQTLETLAGQLMGGHSVVETFTETQRRLRGEVADI